MKRTPAHEARDKSLWEAFTEMKRATKLVGLVRAADSDAALSAACFARLERALVHLRDAMTTLETTITENQ